MAISKTNNRKDNENNSFINNSSNQVSRSVVSEGPSLLQITDEVNSSITYNGTSKTLDAETGDAVWQITRTLRVGPETFVTYANDDDGFVHIWDDRETLFPTPVLSNPASLLFDGVDERITLGDNYDFAPATAFSVSLWFKANNFSAQRCLISKSSVDANVYGWLIYHNSSGKIFIQHRASGSLRSHTYDTTLTAGVWYNLVCTYSGNSNMSGWKVYIDGTLDTGIGSGSLNSWGHSSPLLIASRSNSFHFSGNMNQVSIWDKELSGAEVTELYNSGTPSDLSTHSAYGNVLSWWALNNNTTFPTETDLVGSVDGTLVNMESGDYDSGDVP